jgi:hypothetical protein
MQQGRTLLEEKPSEDDFESYKLARDFYKSVLFFTSLLYNYKPVTSYTSHIYLLVTSYIKLFLNIFAITGYFTIHMSYLLVTSQSKLLLNIFTIQFFF